MTLQAPVSSATPVPLQVKFKTITMAEATLTRTRGGGVKTISGSAGPWGGEKIKQDFDFVTNFGWTGNCAFSNGQQTIAGFEIAASGGLTCTLLQGDERWSLALEATNAGAKLLVGTLSSGETSINVKMARKGSGFLSRFVGYDFAVDGSAVAALQTVPTEQLWLVDGTDPAVAGAIKASVGALRFSRDAVNDAMQ